MQISCNIDFVIFVSFERLNNRLLLDAGVQLESDSVYGEVSEWLKEHAWKVCKR